MPDGALMQILHISASPKGERSASGRIAKTFLDAYAARNPDDEIRERNVFHPLPPIFAREAAVRKFAPFFGEEPTAEGEAAWEQVLRVIADFDSADKIVLSCPMWNYSIPWALKLYLDNLMQPRITFGYDPATMEHKGLLRNRPLQLILTRSSTAPGHFVDFQLPYLRFVFDAIGIRDTRVIVADQTTRAGADARATYLASFDAQARAAAECF